MEQEPMEQEPLGGWFGRGPSLSASITLTIMFARTFGFQTFALITLRRATNRPSDVARASSRPMAFSISSRSTFSARICESVTVSGFGCGALCFFSKSSRMPGGQLR